LTVLTFLLSVATAHAKPSFGVVERSARAGDLVHFTISGVDGTVTYALEVDDTRVLEGTSGGALSGTFTVPDLGDAVRTVTVEAQIRGPDRRRKVERELEYLGSALPVTDPPTPASPPAVPVLPQVAPSLEPAYSPDATEGTSHAPAAAPRSSPRRPKGRKRHAIAPARHVARTGERRRLVHRRRDRRNRDAATRNTRSRRTSLETGPLSGAVPDTGGAQQPGSARSRPAVLVATGARPGDGKGVNAALLVPALLGLAALALTGTAVLRRRRLASRPGSD
jgi:hypothetical protein